jgi:hypothetical protein
MAAVAGAPADPAARSGIADLGMDISPRERQTPEALGALVRDGAEKWWALYQGTRDQGRMRSGFLGSTIPVVQVGFCRVGPGNFTPSRSQIRT